MFGHGGCSVNSGPTPVHDTRWLTAFGLVVRLVVCLRDLDVLVNSKRAEPVNEVKRRPDLLLNLAVKLTLGLPLMLHCLSCCPATCHSRFCQDPGSFHVTADTRVAIGLHMQF